MNNQPNFLKNMSLCIQNVSDIIKTEFLCERCAKQFSGIWRHYKCMNCEDYKICKKCFDEREHVNVKNLGTLHTSIIFILSLRI